MTDAAPAVPQPINLIDQLTARLETLREERRQLLTETTPAPEGDLADRATNVEAHARLALIEQRIAAVEAELAAGDATRDRASTRAGERTVAVGDVVTLDFGEGPEIFTVGPVDVAGNGQDVITPSSPLGSALIGAPAGSTISYDTRHQRFTATVVAIS